MGKPKVGLSLRESEVRRQIVLEALSLQLAHLHAVVCDLRVCS